MKTLKAKFVGTVQTVRNAPKGHTSRKFRGELVFENGETESANGFNCDLQWYNRNYDVDMSEAVKLPEREY